MRKTLETWALAAVAGTACVATGSVVSSAGFGFVPAAVAGVAVGTAIGYVGAHVQVRLDEWLDEQNKYEFSDDIIKNALKFPERHMVIELEWDKGIGVEKGDTGNWAPNHYYEASFVNKDYRMDIYAGSKGMYIFDYPEKRKTYIVLNPVQSSSVTFYSRDGETRYYKEDYVSMLNCDVDINTFSDKVFDIVNTFKAGKPLSFDKDKEGIAEKKRRDKSRLPGATKEKALRYKAPHVENSEHRSYRDF